MVQRISQSLPILSSIDVFIHGQSRMIYETSTFRTPLDPLYRLERRIYNWKLYIEQWQIIAAKFGTIPSRSERNFIQQNFEMTSANFTIYDSTLV